MKFQFSLRALIIACFVAGILVWVGVQFFLTSYRSPELTKRQNAIWSKIDDIVALKDAEYKKNGYSSGGGGGSRVSGPAEWKISVDRYRSNAKGKTVLFALKVQCIRVGVEAQPIEIEYYDDAVENENLVSILKEICEQNR